MLFADADKREIRGRLLPYNELSRVNITGDEPVMFSRGTVKLPRTPMAVWLNVEHDRYMPVGRATELVESDDGVDVVFAIDDTDEGDDALAAVKSGRLRMLSPEVTDFVRDGARALRSRLSGAGLVSEGSFKTAALFAIAANDAAADGQQLPATSSSSSSTPATTPAAQTTSSPAGELDDPAAAAAAAAAGAPAPSQQEEGTMPEEQQQTPATPAAPQTPAPQPAATIPGSIPAPPAAVQQPAQPAQQPASAMFAAANLHPALRRLAAAQGTAEDQQLAQRWFAEQGSLFALNNVVFDGAGAVGAAMSQPQWLGENRGPDFVQRFVPLFKQDTLRSLTMGGFKWGTKPAGGTWAGNKTAIPTNTPTIVPETETAGRWAGGHDIAREHKDFQTPGFFESYEYWMRRSFFEWLDLTVVLTEMLAGATDIVADDPTGLEIGETLSQLVDGAAAVINAGYSPTFATMDTNRWKTIAKVPKSDVLGYLNAQLSLRVDGEQSVDSSTFRIVPAPVGTVTAGHVVVGSRDAGTVYTLPGAPIRAEAINIANGGLDYGFYGYGGLKIDDAAGIVDVAPFAGP
jgi:hypothetical protein